MEGFLDEQLDSEGENSEYEDEIIGDVVDTRFVVKQGSESKPKVLVMLSMNKFMYVNINKEQFKNLDEDLDNLTFNVHDRFWYIRPKLDEFLYKLYNHPRCVVAFASTKMKKNMDLFLTEFRSYIQSSDVWSGKAVEFINWIKDSLIYQGHELVNPVVTYEMENGKSEKVRDLEKTLRIINQKLDDKGKPQIDLKNVISVETESIKMVHHKQNLLKVPSLKEDKIIDYYDAKNDETYHVEDRSLVEDLDAILQKLYDALNNYDDVELFLSKDDSKLGDESDESTGYVVPKTMFSYPNIDIEALKEQSHISWLFVQ